MRFHFLGFLENDGSFFEGVHHHIKKVSTRKTIMVMMARCVVVVVVAGRGAEMHRRGGTPGDSGSYTSRVLLRSSIGYFTSSSRR